jgi:hypothetical protein
MVRWTLPVAARLEDFMRLELIDELRGSPHMVEPAAAVVFGPIR